MSIEMSKDPFQIALSEILNCYHGVGALSLTDRQGDQIATVYSDQAEIASSPEEVGLIQVYGQLAAQKSKVDFCEVAFIRGKRHWLNRLIEIDDDSYHLWAIWSTEQNHQFKNSLTHVEMNTALQQLETKILPLLKG